MLLLYLVINMELKESDITFPIENYDELVVCENKIPHSSFFPTSHIRSLISGGSGAGKTNFLINMLLAPKGLKFQQLILCTNTQNQHKYKFLNLILKEVPEIQFLVCSKFEDFPKVILPFSVIIFDDIDENDFLPIIKTLFTRGRHYQIDVFYLLQSYASARKHFVRDNASFILSFAQDARNLYLIWRDHASADVIFPEFLKMAREAWRKPYNCLTIDKTKNIENGRYRSGLDRFFVATIKQVDGEATSSLQQEDGTSCAAR